MCLEIKHNAKKMTARKDIVVYKILLKWRDGTLRTPFRNCVINIGEQKESYLLKEENEITIGLHSFKSYNLISDKDGHWGRVAKCIIPKGSKYYVGKFDGRISYASDKIKYIKIV